MKKLFLFLSLTLIALSSLALTSCGGDSGDDGGSSSNVDFVVSKTELQFAKEGGSTTISVKGNQTPELVSDASWLTVSQKSASSSVYNYNVTASANTEPNDRTANITVKMGKDAKTIAVVQTASDGLVVGTTSFSVPAEGSEISVKLQSNGDFKVEMPEWIHERAEVKTRASMIDYTRVFIVDANPGSERTGIITFTLNNLSASVTVDQAGASMGDITASAMDIAKLMYPGWNLGNTLEASGSGVNAETAWQSTRTSQQVIDYVKSQGFKSVRIPCSWFIHSNDGDIDAAWMARVKEIVNYCIADGLYVLLNDHWDSGWIEVSGFSESTSSYKAVSEATITAKIAMLKKLWTQIANEFKDYDEHLLFAGMNEPFQQYNLFSNRHAQLVPVLNRYNQAFVEAVRATGGNNARRALVVQGPGTNIDSATNSGYGFQMPADTEEGHLMVEVHYYDPWDFCGAESDATTYYWGASNHHTANNATWGEESHMKSQFAKMKSTFVDKGYPVIIGECGANWRDLSGVSGASQDKHNASIKSFFYEAYKQSVNNGLVVMAWDINSPNQHGLSGTMTILDRSKLSVFCPYAMDGIKEGTAAGTWPY